MFFWGPVIPPKTRCLMEFVVALKTIIPFTPQKNPRFCGPAWGVPNNSVQGLKENHVFVVTFSFLPIWDDSDSRTFANFSGHIQVVQKGSYNTHRIHGNGLLTYQFSVKIN